MGSEAEPTSPPAPLAPAVHVCSRCRLTFPVEPGERPFGPTEWWLCGPCHDKLIGPRSRAAS
jgi:hypothetical protein